MAGSRPGERNGGAADSVLAEKIKPLPLSYIRFACAYDHKAIGAMLAEISHLSFTERVEIWRKNIELFKKPNACGPFTKKAKAMAKANEEKEESHAEDQNEEEDKERDAEVEEDGDKAKAKANEEEEESHVENEDEEEDKESDVDDEEDGEDTDEETLEASSS